MRPPPGFRVRLTDFLRNNEGIRVVGCLALMLALTASGLSLWLALSVPIVTYIGISILFAPGQSLMPPPSGGPAPRNSGPPDREAARRCLTLRDELRELAKSVADEEVLTSLRSIDDRLGSILLVIDEDEKYEAGPSLEDLIELTRRYLRWYVKASRRELEYEEPVAGIRQTFRILADRFERFWLAINRDVIVNLKTLREIIEEEFPDPPEIVAELASPPLQQKMQPASETTGNPPEDPATTLDQPGDENPNEQGDDEIVDNEFVRRAKTESGSAHVNGQEDAAPFTQREKEVVCLVIHGKRDSEIATILFMSPRTPPKHIENAKRKIGAKTRTELAFQSVKLGLVDPGVCLQDLNSGQGMPPAQS
jgi:DNA-binding CsgD family transcriptional regulator